MSERLPKPSGMRTTIMQRGWQFKSLCDCGGSERQHYKHPDYKGFEIRIRPTRQTFVIIGNGMILAGPKQNYFLEEKMKELEIW